MTSISIREMPYDRRDGMPIKELTLDRDNIYFKTIYNDLWRVVVGYDKQPLIELVKHG